MIVLKSMQFFTLIRITYRTFNPKPARPSRSFFLPGLATILYIGIFACRARKKGYMSNSENRVRYEIVNNHAIVKFMPN